MIANDGLIAANYKLMLVKPQEFTELKASIAGYCWTFLFYDQDEYTKELNLQFGSGVDNSLWISFSIFNGLTLIVKGGG